MGIVMPVEPASGFFTFVDANGFGQEIFELLFSLWGLRQSDPDPTIANVNMQYPSPPGDGIPNSVAAVAIGPRSTIDRCWVSWNRQKPFPQNSISGNLRTFTHVVSLGSPLFYTQGANVGGIGVVNSPVIACQKGLFYVFPRGSNDETSVDAPLNDPNLSTVLGTQYVSGLDGTTLLPFSTVNGNHENPFLHLYLYNKPMRFPPGPRYPMYRASTQPITTVRRCIGQLPVYGRRRIRITWTSTTSTVFEVGLLRGFQETAAINLEEIVSTSGSIVRGSVTINDPCADYLNIYGTGDGAGDVTYSLTAIDDPSFT